MEEFVFSLLRCRSYVDVQRAAAEFGPVVCARRHDRASVAVEIEMERDTQGAKPSRHFERRSSLESLQRGAPLAQELRHHVSHVLLAGVATLHIHFMAADNLDLSAIETAEAALKVVLARLVGEEEAQQVKLQTFGRFGELEGRLEMLRRECQDCKDEGRSMRTYLTWTADGYSLLQEISKFDKDMAQRELYAQAVAAWIHAMGEAVVCEGEDALATYILSTAHVAAMSGGASAIAKGCLASNSPVYTSPVGMHELYDVRDAAECNALAGIINVPSVPSSTGIHIQQTHSCIMIPILAAEVSTNNHGHASHIFVCHGPVPLNDLQQSLLQHGASIIACVVRIIDSHFTGASSSAKVHDRVRCDVEEMTNQLTSQRQEIETLKSHLQAAVASLSLYTGERIDRWQVPTAAAAADQFIGTATTVHPAGQRSSSELHHQAHREDSSSVIDPITHTFLQVCNSYQSALFSSVESALEQGIHRNGERLDELLMAFSHDLSARLSDLYPCTVRVLLGSNKEADSARLPQKAVDGDVQVLRTVVEACGGVDLQHNIHDSAAVCIIEHVFSGDIPASLKMGCKAASKLVGCALLLLLGLFQQITARQMLRQQLSDQEADGRKREDTLLETRQLVQAKEDQVRGLLEQLSQQSQQYDKLQHLESALRDELAAAHREKEENFSSYSQAAQETMSVANMHSDTLSGVHFCTSLLARLHSTTDSLWMHTGSLKTICTIAHASCVALCSLTSDPADLVVHAASSQSDSCNELPCNKGYLQQLCSEAQQGGGGIGAAGVQALVFPPLISSSSGTEVCRFSPSILMFPVPYSRITGDLAAETPEAEHLSQVLASTASRVGVTGGPPNSQLFVVFFGTDTNSWLQDDLTIASLFASIMINAVLASRTQQALAQLTANFHLSHQQSTQQIAEDRAAIMRLQAVAEQQSSTIVAHESRVTEYQEINAELQSLVSAKMQEIDAMQRRNQEVSGELAASQTAHALQVTELNACVERLQLQVAAIAELESQLQQATEFGERLHLQLQESERTSTSRAITLAAEQAALNMAEVKAEDLRSALNTSNKALAEVQNQHAQVSVRERKTRDNLENVRRELREKTLELQELRAVVDDLSSSLNKADGVMSQSKTAFDTLMNELSLLKREVLQKDAQAQAVGSERDQLRRRCTNLEELVATHASESGHLKGIINSMSGEFAALSTDRDLLRYKVERLIDFSGPSYAAP